MENAAVTQCFGKSLWGLASQWVLLSAPGSRACIENGIKILFS